MGTMLDLNQLRCFVTVAEELHFGRAAARLHMTQPPLTRHIQQLEHTLGVLLLERSSRRVRMTAAGQVFLPDALRILNFAEQAAASARRVGRGEAGRVTIGFTAVSGYQIVPELISAAAVACPGIDVVLKEMVSVTQIEGLEANTLDLGLVRPLPGHPELEFQLVSREPMMLVLPAGHQLARRKKIVVEDLHEQAFVMYSPNEGKYFYDLIVGLLGTSGVAPRYVQHLGQTHSIVSLVRAGLGMAIVPASAMQLGFSHIDFKSMWRDDVYADMFLAWRRDGRAPALCTFRQFAMEHFARQRAA